MPSLAAHSAVALVAAPHQMRSRKPSEWGSRRRRPGGFGNIGRGLGCGEALAAQQIEEHLGVAPGHVGVGLALGRGVAEVAPPVDHLLGRPAADAELQAAAGDDVGRARVLGHVERVLVAHVDHRRADLDAAGPRADRRQQRERRAELAGEVMHAEIRPVRAQLLGSDGEVDGLQERVGRRARLRAGARASSARMRGSRSSSQAGSVEVWQAQLMLHNVHLMHHFSSYASLHIGASG